VEPEHAEHAETDATNGRRVDSRNVEPRFRASRSWRSPIRSTCSTSAAARSRQS